MWGVVVADLPPISGNKKRPRWSALIHRRPGSAGWLVAVEPGWRWLPRRPYRFWAGAFDAVTSSCSLKHWPDPVVGLAECIRVLGSGGQLVIVEIDGDSTTEQVRRFAGMTRIPPGLREAYVRFAMRTVVGVAPSIDALTDVLRQVGLATAVVRKVDGLPFVVAIATVR
jgi:SAM-dependent methyltransferase